MPQIDLEALVSVSGGSTTTSDRKVACEQLADDHNNPDDISDAPPPDLPPESFWLSKDAEFDWFDRNAFLERKESTRGNSNSAANHSNNNSQRFSLNIKSKTTAILGFPKTQKRSSYVDKRRQCKPTNIRLFPPKRLESVGKSTGAMAEPSSPKVSCMGRVRSKRGRRRKQAEPETKCLKSVEKTRSNQSSRNNKKNDDNVPRKEKKKGFCSSLISLIRRDKSGVYKNCNGEASVKSSRKSSIASKNKSFDHEKEAVAEAPGLGGMNRFVSGRRSESWGAEEVDVEKRDSVDLERSRAGRRN